MGSTQPNPADATTRDAKPKPAIPKGKKEVKILMLHGYTQSGTLFSAKTKGLLKLLIKALSPANLHPTLIFPSGPHKLRPSDIPGYVPPDEPSELDEDELDNWSWFRKDEASGQYRGLDAGMEVIASTISDAGGIDGVMGFSQGGCMAALLASALEPSHNPPPSTNPPPSLPSPSSTQEGWEWLPAVRKANDNKPLKFAVCYSAFYAPPENLQWLYEGKIQTPTLHFLGGLDTVVEEGRSMRLVEMCKDPVVITHPGGHYVPVARDWVMPLVAWLRDRVVEKEKEKENL
ncbi:serine hydrolase FSH [Xylariaceae sp. FL1019]|nr:serine hydrolase FSH [Xylariaceae sp. FL1019]